MERNCSLNDMTIGEKGSVVNLKTKGSMRRRLQDIGLVIGSKVKCVLVSPGGDPIAYRIKGAVIALRSEEAKNIICEIK